MIEALIPFASCAITGNETVDEAAEGMARAFGLRYIALPTGTGSGIGGADSYRRRSGRHPGAAS